MTTHHRLIPPGATSRARTLRAQETEAERALWRLLAIGGCNRRSGDDKFLLAPMSSISSASSIVSSPNATASNMPTIDTMLCATIGFVRSALRSRGFGTAKSCVNERAC